MFFAIAGIDSRYNEGTNELINYLLFGFFTLRKREVEKSGFDEETVDGVLFSLLFLHVRLPVVLRIQHIYEISKL